VWGCSNRTQLITCNGKELRITPNLEIALRAVRRLTKRTLLWADAICIDQDNLKERNHQIRLMTKIYSSAKQVLVWLGHSHIAESAFWTAHRLATDSLFAKKGFQ
jgi:hypothetical protein